jgi:long-subunit acyl-CoA synthetase (AMP-forming)
MTERLNLAHDEILSIPGNRPVLDTLTSARQDREGIAFVEAVKRFAVLERDFRPELDEVTPTSEVKREVVAEHFAETLRGLYA